MKAPAKTLAVALLAIGLIALNYLASAVPARLDLTAERLYTLSPGTVSLLGKLEEPVKLDFYYSRGAEGLPISFKNYAERIQEMLRQYVRAAPGKLQLRIVDPRPDTPAEEEASAAGLTPQASPQGESIYLGLVATLADQQKTIAFFSPQREEFLEYDLSQLIHSVQSVDRPKVGLLSSVPLRSAPDMMAMQMGRRPPPDQFVLGEWGQSVELVTVDPGASALPADLDALAIVHPRNLSDSLQFAIDQFVLSGKPVLLALDPLARKAASSPSMMGQFGAMEQGNSSSLPRLLSAWGLKFEEQRVVVDPELATPVSNGVTVNRMPSWLSLDRGNVNRGSVATGQLKNLLFVDAGALTATALPGVTATPLIETTDQAGFAETAALQFGDPEAAARKIASPGKKTLAMLVQGKFKTAFPAGDPSAAKPGAAPTTAGTKDAAKPTVSALTESKSGSTVIVIGDTDWLFDDYSVRRLNFLGTQAAEPINDNLAFAANLMDFLVGSPDLISLRGKGGAQRPFTVVRRMEAEAQRQYQQQLETLETRLSEVQAKLSELRGKSNEGNRLVASPEARKAIEDFQQQQAAMRGERRQIRAALREGIEALGNRLLLLNLIGPLLLVGAFGLWFHWRRRRA